MPKAGLFREDAQECIALTLGSVLIPQRDGPPQTALPSPEPRDRTNPDRRIGLQFVEQDRRVDEHALDLDKIPRPDNGSTQPLTAASTMRARGMIQAKHVPYNVTDQHGATVVEVGDGQRAALPIGERLPRRNVDNLMVDQFWGRVVPRSALLALREAAGLGGAVRNELKILDT